MNSSKEKTGGHFGILDVTKVGCCDDHQQMEESQIRMFSEKKARNWESKSLPLQLQDICGQCNKNFLDETSVYIGVEQMEPLEVALRIKGRKEEPI